MPVIARRVSIITRRLEIAAIQTKSAYADFRERGKYTPAIGNSRSTCLSSAGTDARRKQGRVILKVGAAESPAAVQNLAISRCFL
ncbi:MAG: hypothetical protein KME26_32530 [Oscillatoria princeps RMCB-10]|nr:hypothetical protein [Oscillatoria princeps RMCB-10]